MSLRCAAGQRLTVEALTGSGGGWECLSEGRRGACICQENIAAPPAISLRLPCRHVCRVPGQAADGVIGPAALPSRAGRRRRGHRRCWSLKCGRAFVNTARLRILLGRGGWRRRLLRALFTGKATGRQQGRKKERLNNDEGVDSKHFDFPPRRYYFPSAAKPGIAAPSISRPPRSGWQAPPEAVYAR